eukprot:6198781-Pleurochrysis_carterae.AAC.1
MIILLLIPKRRPLLSHVYMQACSLAYIPGLSLQLHLLVPSQATPPRESSRYRRASWRRQRPTRPRTRLASRAAAPSRLAAAPSSQRRAWTCCARRTARSSTRPTRQRPKRSRRRSASSQGPQHELKYTVNHACFLTTV